MQRYSGTVLRQIDDPIQGNVAVGVSVLVKNLPSGTVATLYLDDGLGGPPAPIDNPLTTDNLGRFTFYADNGKYLIEVLGTTSTQEITLADGAQPLDATLTGLAALNPTANQMMYATGTNTFSIIPTTAYGRGLLNTTDATSLANQFDIETKTQKVAKDKFKRQMTIDLNFAEEDYGMYDVASKKFVKQPLEDILTIIRAGNATATHPVGVVNYTDNEARLEYSPKDERLGLLCEAARTNLFTYSEDFSNAAWSKQRITVTSASGIAPDGTNTATLLSDTFDVGDSYLFRPALTFTSGLMYTVSFYAKKYGNGVANLQVALKTVNGFLSNTEFLFDLTTGVITGSASGYFAAMEPDPRGDGWWRCSLSAVCQTTTTANYIAATINSTTPDLTSNQILLWGAQLEANSLVSGVHIPSSYIKTLATTILRSITQYTKLLDNLFNKNGSTVVVEYTPKSSISSTNGVFGVGNATTANAITIMHNGLSNLTRVSWYSGGVSPTISAANNTSPLNVMSRAVVTFHSNGTFALAVNGVDYGTSTATTPDTAAWTRFFLGTLRTLTDNPINIGTIQRFSIIPRFFDLASERQELSRQ
jgi:hypothetical protein